MCWLEISYTLVVGVLVDVLECLLGICLMFLN